jgi:hypothetical protein
MRTLSYQLLERFKKHRFECMEKLTVEAVSDGKFVNGGGIREAVEVLFEAPLRELRATDQTPVVILVDALDEGLSVAHEILLSEVLKGQQNKMMRLVTDHLAKLPAELGVRVVATSRAQLDPKEAYLEHIVSTLLGEAVSRMDVAGCRREELLDARLSTEVASSEVMENLRAASNGSMVYFRLVLEAARLECSLVSAASPSLSDAYTSYLKAVRRSTNTEPHDDDLCNLLSVSMAVREPLSLAPVRL